MITNVRLTHDALAASGVVLNMTNLASLPHRIDVAAATCRVVIETPAGSRQKFAYDPGIAAMTLSSILNEGLVLPLAFGFVPSTRAEDGDPLDVMIFFDEPVPPGLVAQARLLGAIEAEETEEGRTFRNDRLIAAAVESTRHAHLRTLEDLPDGMLGQLDFFWSSRNSAKGVDFRVLRHVGPAAAVNLVQQAAR